MKLQSLKLQSLLKSASHPLGYASRLAIAGSVLLSASVAQVTPLQARQSTPHQSHHLQQPPLIADTGHSHGHGEPTLNTSETEHGEPNRIMVTPRASETDEHEGHRDPMPDHGDHSGHNHAPLEVPAGMPVPTLDLVVYEDPVNGWNLELQVTNFRFAPENVNGPSNTEEGHAHLYINGEKMSRIYSAWHHLPALPPGNYDIMVELNANGHEPLVYQGQAIADSEQITVVSE